MKNEKEYNKREYSKKWRKDNLDYIKEYKEQWQRNNPNYCKEYYQTNKERMKEQHKKWRENNPAYAKKYNKDHAEQHKICMKKWRKDNPEYRKQWMNVKRKTDLKCNFNTKISNAIRQSLNKNKNGKHWENLVGYTLGDLMKRLKSTMPKGYDWNDYLKGHLHIDHRIPISAFNFSMPEHIDFKRCWALENLRLLPAKENMIKHNKLSKPFQPALKIY